MVTIQIPLEVLQSMKKIIDYGIGDEERHYNASFQETKSDMLLQSITQADDINTAEKLNALVAEQPGISNHIYNDFELVNRFLHSQDLQADIDNSLNRYSGPSQDNTDILPNY